ncbi:MAG: DUF502 domain-containing protein [Cyclobacteriaceae bacterium]|nr:DUF502 domain-containing protein [Cyclobacteriaceae bacterium]
MAKLTIQSVLSYFFRGLLFVIPLTLTIYVITIAIQWIDGLLGFTIPGMGLLIILSVITIVGYLGSFFITRPFFEFLERAVEKVPFISLIYTSLKDLVGAFVGDKKKFDKPVIVQLDAYGSVYKMGFITQSNLSELGLEDLVSVYLPHSYNFSGNQFLVPRHRVKALDVNGTQAMKFIVSGGVSGLGKK